MLDDPLNAFAQDIVREVDERLDAEAPFSEEIFTQLVLERLEDAGHFQNTFDLYQEGRISNATYRIYGYAFDEDRSRLDLFTTIFSADLPPEKISKSDATMATTKAIRFASACVDGLASKLEPSNTDASDLARLIEDKASELTSIRVVLLTNGIVSNSGISTDWRGVKVEFEAYDLERLYRILGEGETRADIDIDLVTLSGNPVPCLHVPGRDDEYDAFFAVIPGEVLSKIYERYGVRLLELNVRAFLGLQGRKSVNAELRRTIVDQPTMFLAFNNGIVATVDDIELEDAPTGKYIRSLKGLQIVNGGQTTASLHRARRKESVPLEGVAVAVKIIKVGGADLAEMVSSISRAANRQNTVQLADFSANDPFHQQVETLANNTWLDDGKGRWFYERARGSYIAAEQKAGYRKTDTAVFRRQTPKQRRLSKLDLARYLNAWSGLPNRVCLGGQKNFQYFMQRLKDEPPPPPDATWFKRVVAIAVLYRGVEKKIRSMKFPAYRAQIAAYLVAGLSHRVGGRMDFGYLWSRQAISAEMEDLAGEWATQIDGFLRSTAGQRNPSEWFKKEDCWTELMQLLPRLSEPLPPEMSFGESATEDGADVPLPQHSVIDYDRIEQCMGIQGAIWLQAAELGQRNGVLHWKLAGICRTIAGYAAGGWVKKPSAKQARYALEALRSVEQAGLIKSVLQPEATSAD